MPIAVLICPAKQHHTEPHSDTHSSTSRVKPPTSFLVLHHHHFFHHLPQLGFIRNLGSSVTSQVVKQQQQQAQQSQYQQPARQHPNQPKHQSKLLKGIGRGNMFIHQNNYVDPSHINGLSAASGSQPVEKGDQTMHHNSAINPSSQLFPYHVPISNKTITSA
ncbi:unnamed protein product [Vicia faba]|uniref:Uncharacterized protein n=1 Tax=Vicia faba TaxID=3906 RepID=A0AAV1AW48_VICFA|nr:unnamed protein product [Vicia faba]